MNMIPVIKVNNVVCEQLGGNKIKMYGRKKMLYTGKTAENHILTGKWTSVRIAKVDVWTPSAKPEPRTEPNMVVRLLVSLIVVALCSIVA